MNKNSILRMSIDFFMIILMILEMGGRVTGIKIHMVMGIILFVLFVLHNILNIKWYKSIKKGRMSISKFVRIAVNVLLLINMIILMVSALFLTDFMKEYVQNSIIFIFREIHVTAAYCLFILISIHLGMHWSIIINKISRSIKISAGHEKFIKSSIKYALRTAAIVIFLYGMKSFIDRDIALKMINYHTKNSWKKEASLFKVFIDYLSIMGSYVFMTYYLLKYFKKKKQ